MKRQFYCACRQASKKPLAVHASRPKAVIVVDDRTAYGQGAADESAKQAKLSGLKVAACKFTNDKAADMTAILTNLKSKNVDV